MAVFPLILTLQMYINYNHVHAAWVSVFLAMACNIYEVVHVACQSLSCFFYAATSNDFVNVKSYARKKPLHVGYFSSLSVDQIKTHQSRN